MWSAEKPAEGLESITPSRVHIPDVLLATRKLLFAGSVDELVAIRVSEFERGVMLFSRKNFQPTIQPTTRRVLRDFL